MFLFGKPHLGIFLVLNAGRCKILQKLYLIFLPVLKHIRTQNDTNIDGRQGIRFTNLITDLVCIKN